MCQSLLLSDPGKLRARLVTRNVLIMRRLIANTLWGILWGIAVAGLYSLYVGAIYLLQGPAPFESHGTSILSIVAAYFGGGVVSGAIVGLLRPLSRWQLGAGMLGMIAAVPVFLAFDIAQHGFAALQQVDVFAMTGFALALGGGAGWGVWKLYHE